MRTIMVGLAVLIVGSLGSGASLGVGSTAQWQLVAMLSLNSFVRLTNQTIAFVNEQIEGEVSLLPELRSGIGLRFAQAFGETWQIGFQMALLSVGTATQGMWTRGTETHPVNISLEAGLGAVEAGVAVAVVPKLVTVGVTAGWGAGRVSYRSEFPTTLTTEWSLPFRPRVETMTYIAHGPVGSAYARVSLPVRPGMAVGIEAGFRWTALGVPQAGTSVLDLNADGWGDPVDFSGPWLGLTVRMEFSL